MRNKVIELMAAIVEKSDRVYVVHQKRSFLLGDPLLPVDVAARVVKDELTRLVKDEKEQ